MKNSKEYVKKIQGKIHTDKGVYIGDPISVFRSSYDDEENDYYNIYRKIKTFNSGIFELLNRNNLRIGWAKAKNYYIDEYKNSWGVYSDNDDFKYLMEHRGLAIIPLEYKFNRHFINNGRVIKEAGDYEFSYDNGIITIITPSNNKITINTNINIINSQTEFSEQYKLKRKDKYDIDGAELRSFSMDLSDYEKKIYGSIKSILTNLERELTNLDFYLNDNVLVFDECQSNAYKKLKLSYKEVLDAFKNTLKSKEESLYYGI